MRLSKQMGRSMRFVMDLVGDTAETILREYEGYTIDEMNELLSREGLLRKISEVKEKQIEYKEWLEDELARVKNQMGTV